MSSKKKSSSGNPAKRADTAAPADGSIALDKVVRHLAFQRDEAKRRHEPEKWQAYLEETLMNMSIANSIIVPGLGAVPTKLMGKALDKIDALT